MKYYIGVDLGGTNIAAGIVDERYNLIYKKSIPTVVTNNPESIAEDIVSLVKEVSLEASIDFSDVLWLGIGTPGAVDQGSGCVNNAHNIGFYNFNLKEYIQNKLPLKCFIENDANAAAYGEFVCGGAKDYNSAILITIGTGIGSGIIIDNKIFSGCAYTGAEMGHMVIIKDGEECTCGRKGCFESYCSATALIKQTKTAMVKHPESTLWQIVDGNINKVNGKTVFDGLKLNDLTSKEIFEDYTDYFSVAIANLVNIFAPEVVLLGGGVSNAGDILINNLNKKVSSQTYIKKENIIKVSQLKGDAGIIGAALLGLLYK